MTDPAKTTAAPYRIDIDEKRRIIRLTLVGLWDLDTLARYTADVKQAFARAQAAGMQADRLRVLIDLREHSVQPRDVAQRIQEQLAAGESPASRHAVLVSPSALHRMQAQRVGSELGQSFFSSDEDDAIGWLLTGASTDATIEASSGSLAR